MTTIHTYSLTNMSAHQYIDLPVAEGQDVVASAQAHLRESELPKEVQEGFYISVHPTGRLAEPAPRATPFPVIADSDLPIAESQRPAAADRSEAPSSDGDRSDGSLANSSSSVDASRGDIVPDDTPEGAIALGQSSGSLAAAAAAGPLHWTDDSEDEPTGPGRPLIIGVPFGGSGGH